MVAAIGPCPGLFRLKGGLGRVDLWSYRDFHLPVMEKVAPMLAK